ncbi:MAG: hypothetical protein Q9202_005003 [Teloschistes flavicans]
MSYVQWSKFEGFTGEGIYAIINKKSLTALETNSAPEDEWAHTPDDGGKVYGLSGKSRPVIAESNAEALDVANLRDHLYTLQTGALWAIDSAICCLEEGNMVKFRDLEEHGYVLELENGKVANGTKVLLGAEISSEKGDKQKWLLLKQA